MSALLRPAIAIASATLLVAACGTGDSSGPSATTSGEGGASSASSRATPLRMGSLPAGTYRTNRFDPQLVFKLPAGWSQFFPDEDDEIYMHTDSAELAVSRPAQVRDPATGNAMPAPEDLLGWLVEHPDLGSPEPTAVEIDGIESHYVEPSTTHDVGVFAFPGGDYRIVAGSNQRVYVIPLDGPDVAVTIGAAPSGTLADAIPAAEPIVESLELVD